MLAGKLPAVEVGALRDVRRIPTIRWARRAGAKRAELPFFHGGAEIRVAPEKFDLGLGLRTVGYAQDKPEENEELEHRQGRGT